MAKREDYERTNAREWDLHYKVNSSTPCDSPKQATVSSPESWEEIRGGKKLQKARQRGSPQKWKNTRGKRIDDTPRRHPPPNLLVDVDNEAQQAWRNREQPKDSIKIPDELALQDRTHETLAQQHGAFILSEHSRGINGAMMFDIWGEDGAVAATKRAINAWITDWRQSLAVKSNRSLAFAKVVSLTPKLREIKEKAWLREVKKQRFRQHPPPGTVFEAIGTFHWPREYRPEEILGMSYEALDPIRMDCKCYVVFVKERSMFQVSGRAKDVQRGLLRLRKTCFQIDARRLSPVRLYLPHWSNASILPSHVHMQPYEHSKTLFDGDTADVKGNTVFGEGALDDTSLLNSQTNDSEERLKKLLLQTLRRLHYYRGDIQVRIRLGRFLATQFKKPENEQYELEEFLDMTKESQFIGQVSEELGNKEIEHLALSALQSSEHLLQPEDAITMNLEAVRPVYSATFTFADEAGDLCLAISWRETEDKGALSTSFDIISKKWTRLERDISTRASLLDVSLFDLNTGRAWQFDIQASQSIDEARLSKKLVDFAYSVKFDDKAALQQTFTGNEKSFVTYKPYAVNLKHLRQILSYRYHIRSSDGFVTDYTLDLTRFQDRTYPARKTASLVAAAEPTVVEPRWSLNLYRTEWDTALAQNESLKVGEIADWKDDVDTWFPEDPQHGQQENQGLGFEHLMGNLKRIEKVMRAIGKEDLIGGMTID